MRKTHGFGLPLLLYCLVIATPARASLLASDSFVYPAGQLNGLAGGTGWSGAWITGQPTVFVVQAASLASTIGPVGGALFFDGSKAAAGTGARVFRQLDLSVGSAAALAGVSEANATRFNGTQAAIGKPGTVVWFGIVINGGTAGNGVAGVQYLAQVHLYDGATTTASALALGDNNKDGEAMAIGRGNTNVTWNYERTCGHDNCPSHAAAATNYVSAVIMDAGTHWLVMRFDFASAATTNVTTWLDPTPGVALPSDPSAMTMGALKVVPIDGLHFNCVELGGQTSQFSFDEVRFATTFGELSSNATLGVSPATGVRDELRIAAGPSPATGDISFRFHLPNAGPIDISVVDVTGVLVRTLQSGTLGAGDHTLHWDGRDAASEPARSGLYMVRLHSQAGDRMVKVVRLR